MRRSKMNGRGSRKLFTRTARGSHPKNNRTQRPMRGGIRL